MKVHLRGRTFQINDVPKRDVLNWLRCQDKTFLAILARIEFCLKKITSTLNHPRI
jgi:hypothetical protein